MSMTSLRQKTSPVQPRRRRLRDENAPKRPRSGYVLFLANRRADFERTHLHMTNAQLNSALAVEWACLDTEQKEKFQSEAAKEREQFEERLRLYRQTDHYRNFLVKKSKLMKQRRTSTITSEQRDGDDQMDEEEEIRLKEGDIPIFSESFLRYNRERENQLRNIRRQLSGVEDEERLLKKRIIQLENNTDAIKSEIFSSRMQTEKINSQLINWRKTLHSALSHLHIPGHPIPNKASFDMYMRHLHKMINDNSKEHEQFLTNVRGIVHRLNFSSSS